MNKNLNCTVILLSYNSKNVTDECLTRLKKAVNHTHNALKNSIEVIVVENGSKDGSKEMIQKKHKFVMLLALKENLGYAAGNNYAMKKVKTPFILLMNSDTYVEKDSITKSFKKMQEKEKCDVLVSKWVTEDKVFHSYGGYLPTPSRIVRWALGFESMPLIKSFLPRIYSYNPSFYKKENVMQWCPPCFMLLKREVYTLTGGFDEKLWFHMVDVEWCKRMNQKRLTICFTPTVTVMHLGGASSKGLEVSLMSDNFKGLMHFCRKHYPKSAGGVAMAVKFGLKIRSSLFFLLGKKELAGIYQNLSSQIHISA